MPESYVEALYPYQAAEKNQISLQPHEKIQVLEEDESGWWIGRNNQGNVGIFPSTYVKKIKTEKVFNKPKEIKPLPQPHNGSADSKPLSREAKLANDLGIEIEEGDDSDIEDPMSPIPGDVDNSQLVAQVEELQRQGQVAEAERIAAVNKMQAAMTEATECRKKEEMARTQLQVLKKTNIAMHETNRRLTQEVDDLKSELLEDGRTVPEFKYDCTADEAIEKFLESAVGTLKKEHEDLQKRFAEVQESHQALESSAHMTTGKNKKSENGTTEKEDGETNGNAEDDGSGAVKQEDYNRLRAKYKKLEGEYKKIRKENKEMKASGSATEGGCGGSGGENSEQVEKYKERIARLKEELEAAKQGNADAEEKEKDSTQNREEVEELKAKMQKLDKKRKAEIQLLTEEKEKAEAGLKAMTQVNEELIKAKEELAASQSGFTEQLDRLKDENKQVQTKLDKIHKEKQAEYDELMKKYKKEEKMRRQYFNELQELKGNIRVFCRCKPASPEDVEASGGLAVQTEDGLAVKVLDEATGKNHTFEFDVSYSPGAKQEEIFNDVKPLATSVLDGYNVCIFAYGQTGSGKTYTMEGPPDNRGVNFRTVQELFRLVAERQGEYSTEVKIAVIEVYNEQIYDLLGGRNKLDVRYTDKTGVQVPDMKLATCKDEHEVLDTLYKGYECRKTASTNMNEHSSRSHCLLSIYCFTKNLVAGTETVGKLHLVDLAGSERMTKTGAAGKERVDEAKNINSSLTHLGIVINALANKRDHIPYRNSALTKLLQDSLEKRWLAFSKYHQDSMDNPLILMQPVQRQEMHFVCD